MFRTDEDLKACVQNGKPCEFIRGHHDKETMERMGYLYMNAGCVFGWECGRGECCRYTPSQSK